MNSIIDTLRFTTDQQLHIDSKNSGYNISTKTIPFGNYQFAMNYTVHPCNTFPQGTSIAVSSRPVPGRFIQGFTQVTVQPGDFDRWDDFILFIRDLVPEIDLRRCLIREMHLFVDVPIDVDFFRRHLHISRMRKQCHYFSDGYSIIIGKKPKSYIVYDKGVMLGLDTPLTRVEAKYVGNACPITRFDDISKLREFDPFADFVFFELCNGKDSLLNRGLRDSINNNGMFTAIRKDIGTNRVGRLLQTKYLKTTSSLNLSELYKDNLLSFFEIDKETILKG